jgi:hypothetical protein
MSAGLPATTARVAQNTREVVNRRIGQSTDRVVRYYASHPERIAGRLAELDREWDIERALQLDAASLTLGGMALAVLADRRFLVVPAVVGGFLLQHALQGWCPPLPLLRRLGFRTAAEIAEERYALKAVRGDFERVGMTGASDTEGRAAEALAAART